MAATWTTPVLEGEVVRLEPIALAHEEGLWQASRDPRTWQWLSIQQPQTRAELRAYLDAALAAADGASCPSSRSCARAAASSAARGSSRCGRSMEHRDRWTWLTPEAWGTGANVEAKLLMLEHAFGTLGCLRVELKTDAQNERSRGAMAALPAQFEGCTESTCSSGGERRDSAWYSVLDDEWPAVRANLLRRLGGARNSFTTGRSPRAGRRRSRAPSP